MYLPLRVSPSHPFRRAAALSRRQGAREPKSYAFVKSMGSGRGQVARADSARGRASGSIFNLGDQCGAALGPGLGHIEGRVGRVGTRRELVWAGRERTMPWTMALRTNKTGERGAPARDATPATRRVRRDRPSARGPAWRAVLSSDSIGQEIDDQRAQHRSRVMARLT